MLNLDHITGSIMLGKAIEFATQKHSGQTDKGGEPYILHPIRLMLKFSGDFEAMAAAVLHDVLEDTDAEVSDLRELGMTEKVIHAVTLLTRFYNSSYTTYIARIARDSMARAIKMADFEDNLNVLRLRNDLTEKDLKRVEKYHKFYRLLKERSKWE